MPQGGTYPDPECFWDAAVLQFVAPAEMRERESAETRRHFKAEPGSDHSFSDHQPFKLIWIAKSSAITKQNLVRIITGLKSYNWLDGLLLSKREGNTNLVKSTFLKWKLPFPHLNQHQCWVIASSKLQASPHTSIMSQKKTSVEKCLSRLHLSPQLNGGQGFSRFSSPSSFSTSPSSTSTSWSSSPSLLSSKA